MGDEVEAVGRGSQVGLFGFIKERGLYAHRTGEPLQGFVLFSSLQDFKQRQGLTSVCFEKIPWGPSLVVQWITLPAPSAGDLGSVPGLRCPHTITKQLEQPGHYQKKKKEEWAVFVFFFSDKIKYIKKKFFLSQTWTHLSNYTFTI